MTTHERGPILLTTLGAGDPLRLLLRRPGLVIAADPCDVHRARLELRLAALKCLGRPEFLQLGDEARWPRLYPRFRWLAGDSAARAWDGRVPELASARVPDVAEFEEMKVNAGRLQIVARPLDGLLEGLPENFADAVVAASACGADPARLAAGIRRVVRRGKTAVLRVPAAGVAT